jgi:hypothetical protein
VGAKKNSLRGLCFIEATPRYIVFEVKPGEWMFNPMKP